SMQQGIASAAEWKHRDLLPVCSGRTWDRTSDVSRVNTVYGALPPFEGCRLTYDNRQQKAQGPIKVGCRSSTLNTVFVGPSPTNRHPRPALAAGGRSQFP